MFARRREIEVMKLVGATNWFIRVPFMLEGPGAGLMGGAVGIGIVFGVAIGVAAAVARPAGGICADFRLTVSDVQQTGFVLVVVGGVVGVFGSSVAATRFLDV